MKRFFTILAFLLLAPHTVLAATFSATVDRNSVQMGDNLTLQLTLSGTSADKDPDLSALKPSFTILSEGQTSNTQIFNGKTSMSVGWVLTLAPKKTGAVTIPALNVDTAAGPLHSAPITITVTQGPPNGNTNSATSAPSDGRAVTISASVDYPHPYQDQAIRYTVRVYARADIANVSLQAPAPDDAVVKQLDKPAISNETINGRPVRVILFHYLITPLKAGVLTIPPAILNGQVESTAPQAFNPFGGGFPDPFHMMQALNAMPGFSPMTPFSIASNKVSLNVKAPPVAMNPWLPLDSLTIKEDWDATRKAQVGVPLTRKLTLVAEGGAASQLPDLKAQQNDTDFKVYADKAQTNETTDKGSGISYAWRTETYNLIPVKAGQLTLPAIHVPYWNLKTDSIASADLPARIVDVAPAAAGATAQTATKPANPAPSTVAPPAKGKTVLPSGGPRWLYAILGGLILILIAVVLWAVHIQKQMTAIKKSDMPIQNPDEPQPPPTTPPPLSKKNRPAFGLVETPQDLYRFLQDFAHERWAVPRTASLESIAAAWPDATGDLKAFIDELNAALYANTAVDIGDLKGRLHAFIKAAPVKLKPESARRNVLPGLNPE